MPVSRLFIALVFMGIPVIASGAWIGSAIQFMVTYNLILVVLFFIDYLVTPKKEELIIKRVCNEKLSMGTENVIEIAVRNNSETQIEIKVRDSYPEYFKVINQEISIKIPPHDDKIGSYTVIPMKRGAFDFDDIYVKIHGILKLCVKTFKYEAEERYKVYPNLRDISKYGIRLANKMYFLEGEKRVKTISAKTEFESIREYAPGDDIRKINHMASARFKKWMINTFEDEKNQNVMIMIDSSRMMNQEINEIKKMDYAINSAILLADIVIRKGDRAGVMVFDSVVHKFLRPGKGQRHFQSIVESLYNVEENIVSPDFPQAFNSFATVHRRRSLICIFTEIFNTEEATNLIRSIKSNLSKHLALVILIRDQRIIEMADNEMGKSGNLFLRGAALYCSSEREKIVAMFSSAGIPCIDVNPDKLSSGIINKYLEMKRRIEI